MRQIHVPSSLRALALVALTTCGGGSDSGTNPPPPPASVATLEVTPPSAQIVIGATQPLTAITKDASGATLTGRTVSWSSSNQGIASVSSAGLVTGVSVGQATITAVSEGKSGLATVTVALPSFLPSGNTTLSGTQRFARATIPAGVVVTAGTALNLTVQDSLIIRGILTGDCVPVTLIAATVVIEGDVKNACSVDPAADEPPVLRIVSGSTLELGPGITESSGDIVITNDTTLADGDFPPVLAGAAGALMANADFRGNCRTSGRTWRFPSRTPGSTGQTGGSGRPGRTFRMDCAGDLIMANGAIIQAQHGAEGGPGTHSHPANAFARGGNGGRGGEVRLRATGSILVAGLGNEIRTGNGGIGGNAIANGQQDPSPPRAASATAIGGDGGAPGLATLLAGGSIAPVPGGGGLTIVIGNAGHGSLADALAANGVDAAVRNGAAQNGGNATATGGSGGSTPNKKLNASGSVSLIVGVQGGNAGGGGIGNARAGNAGNGSEAFPPGGEGGRMEANGGNGGSASLLDAAGQLVGLGGGGAMGTGSGARGGDGYSDCVPGSPRRPGGDGGPGGSGFGRGGFGGTGRIPGESSRVLAQNTGRGGNGGRGSVAGVGGAGGADRVQRPADVAGSFGPGDPATRCSGPTLAQINGFYRLQATLLSLTGNGCPAGFFLPTINNPGPIAFTVASASTGASSQMVVLGQVRIQSNFLVVGNVNDDGTYSGSGSGTLQIGGTAHTTLEMIRGTFEETGGGGVRLNTAGELEFRLFGGGSTCIAVYRPATYTKIVP